ncbi:2-oxoacid:acceptor oxidoreductase family protein [Candidatus Omnitrophota bacterium]
MTEEVICAGFGGQGIMLLGKFIAFGSMKNGLSVTWMPSYGAEVRGGTAHSMVVVSDEEVASPIISFCDTAIMMNKPSLDRFGPRVRSGGTLLINSSLIEDDIKRKDINILRIPMTDIAHMLGNVKAANMVALGAYMRQKNLFPKDIVFDGIEIAFPGKQELIDINKQAVEEGLKIDG